ncbi:S26 family signal peptidase [Vaccinium witches'-broom phytoplasma]|uniref:S26 family signal peptidase n=1 Tax=Vaccinium witches'-broom phytoplasma TaxID=85642 RepID=UPI000361B1FC|nr:S26 family signal peptidase [Vaccinium witches'-broom phytoplasma]
MKKNDHSPIKNIFKTIVTVFNYVILFLVVLMMLFNVFGSLATTLKYFRFSLSKVPTKSMYPAIKPGDYVLIKYISDEDKKKLKPGEKDGDIIVFEPSGKQANDQTSDISDLKKQRAQYVIHRVVKNIPNNKGNAKDKDKTLITTKGDNNKESSDYETNLRYEDIIAKHVLIIPKFYVYFVFFVVLILFMFDLCLSYIKDDDEEEEEYEEYEEEEE